MTEPVSNVMLVITTYTPLPDPTPVSPADIDWCLELAASVDVEPVQTRAKNIFETLAVHPHRKFALATCTDKPERRSLNSPYFRLLKARARRVQQQQKKPVSSLSLAVNPSCRAYLKLNEQKDFSARTSATKLRQLVCTMSAAQKTPAPVPQDAVRTAHDPVRTVRLQPFFVGQPLFSPA